MKPSIFTFALLLIFSPIAKAATVANVEIPDVMQAAGTELQLNGAGVRSKWFVDVYVSGLYLLKASQNAAAIVKADEPMAIKLQVVSGMVTSEKMQKATVEGFEDSTHGNTAPIQQQINQFISVFDQKILENDIFDLVYVPGKGIEVYKNNELSATIESGLPFKKALFGIWLSDKPIQKDLKKAMLGSRGQRTETVEK